MTSDLMRASLLGLSVGDALGSQFFVPPNRSYFVSGDPAAAARDAALSAEVTHPHPEAVAGAVAVAVAAALRAAGPSAPGPFLDEILRHVASGRVRTGIVAARRLLPLSDASAVARVLGNGRLVAAHDTVPFTLWVAARHGGDYRTAFWATAAAGGDVDTTCAIVGGILGTPPPDWAAGTEPLPSWLPAPY
ncbi:ADP-ribosylglycohydrolase [Actinomadura rubteroloni]|uniref:ADP-ribosylglycohydrolase n=1 Tax=Actinomadura rubteroloni TaxID=1926885 RepID=A0A2P4UNZ5_9ACTN|nr:ADP-ribosylglycohydrolase family protein [Actinomadura rubteroloni]POM26771.1 ADP-ribosylglycohydrolase [Actinomadura rubteroloni]